VAYKKQQDIQEYHYYKFDSKDLPTIWILLNIYAK
jgi:hypothetical protein